MSSMPFVITLHLFAVIAWVGGMFFAYMVLRPVAASQLEPPARLTLWAGVFDGFFPWVWAAVALILGSGLWMIFGVLGGMQMIAPFVHLMFALGLGMMAIFMHVYFAPYRRLKRAVAAQDWPEGGKQLAQIRKLVGFNTLLGFITAMVAVGGRYL